LPRDAFCWSSANQRESITPKEVIVNITNTSGEARTIGVVALGTNLQATWSDGSDTATLKPNEPAMLRLVFKPETVDKQDLALITLFFKSKPLINITVDYLLAPDTIELVTESGDVPEGPGDSFSPTWFDGAGYRLGSKVVPEGYSLIRACEWLTGDRPCNTYSTCGWAIPPTEKGGVVFSFTLQGHKESGDIRKGNGHLYVKYQLDESTPRLIKSTKSR
jgi:hypothetical protein